jgi:ABC-2 type transport system permease protein
MAVQPAITTPDVVGVRVPEGGLRQDLRAIKIVWQRELIRFKADRARMFSSLLQPVLYLFVLGTGLSSLTGRSAGGIDLKTFIFPGVVAMALLFTAAFSAGSIVWDREFGFLREMLVAPVRRGAILVGKSLGGATVAAIQGVIMLSLAGAVHVPYSPVLLATLIGELLLLAFTITALGLMAAARIRSMQSFFALVQMFLLPMFFLSGALYPLSNLPAWLRVLTRIDPLTYAVDPMRRAVFAHLNLPAPVQHVLNPGVTWFGWRVPTLVELGLVAVMGLVMLAVAIAEFSRAE